MGNRAQYRIIGAYDTETTNIGNSVIGWSAFPILYQLGLIDCNIEDIGADNFEEHINIEFFRNATKLYARLDAVIDSIAPEEVGVILVHNLGFDMYSLAPWLNNRNTRVLAKTARKPITITICDSDNNPRLVFLDTLGLFMKSLARMGEECGIPKAMGDWDYLKIRTPETPLTDNELFYARRDLETLIVYVSYFLKMNPDIEASEIGLRVVTKTGIVRNKRMKHLGALKGVRLNRTVNQYWNYHNRCQRPKTDNELFTMHTCTRGGFTFCARNNASKIFIADEAHTIAAYDATSQHPAQMVSHFYPVDFTPATVEELECAINLIRSVDLARILNRWARPFPVAFNALFAFENLRPKNDSLYGREGIFPLASARLKPFVADAESDNESSDAFQYAADRANYSDTATNARLLFGKIESAEYCELWLTELALWEVIQSYDFDSIKPVGGYLTLNFRKPTDLCLLSVMRFYQAKNALKKVRSGKENPEILRGLFPDSFVESYIGGDLKNSADKEYYQLAKADLNALFG